MIHTCLFHQNFTSLDSLLLLLLGKEVGVLLEGTLGVLSLRPQVGGQEGVGVANGSECSLDEVAQGTGGATGGGVAVGDTSELQELLRGRGGDNAGTAGSRDETTDRRTALAGDLRGDGMRLTKSGAPVAATNGDDRELGKDDGATDSGGNFLRALNTKTDVTIVVTNDDEGLETGALTGTGLLLYGHDLHDLILQFGEEEVNNLILLDGEREQVDLFNGLDLAILNEATELGNGDPLLVLVITTATTIATATATAPVAATSTSSIATTTTSKTTASTATIGRC